MGPTEGGRAGSAICTWERVPGEAGSWVMVGKTFKGMTDELLAWQTQRLGGAIGRNGSGWCASASGARGRGGVRWRSDQSATPGGLALRFARVKGYRADKIAPEEADSIDTVRRIFRGDP